jgi:signal peptide peptidase SppA
VTPDLLQAREWLIQPDALHVMAAAVRAFHDRGGKVPGAPPTSSLLSVDGGIGVVAIEGPILRKPGMFARVFLGAADSEEIGAALNEAATRPDVKAVFLDIDSPGGTVLGTPELAGAVAALNAQKPVYAFSSGLMCSAAYWIASQARAIYATPSAQVGSIGVVQAIVDNSTALDKAGIKVEVFSVGKYKAMGAPGTPLTDDQRELISSNLAEIASDFHEAVLSRGRAIPAEAMEGQTFSGRQAQRHNLAGMVRDRAEAMQRLRVYHAASVDTGSRAMNTTVEDELAQARTELAGLQQDHEAQAQLLGEASAATDSLRGEVEALTAQLDTLTGERDTAHEQVASLQATIAQLQAAQTDFDRRVQTEVARVVASTGTTLPARVTPAGDSTQPTHPATLDSLVAEYDRLVTERKPEEAAAFFQQHLAQHFTR